MTLWLSGESIPKRINGLPEDASVMMLEPGIPRISNISAWQIHSVPEELEGFECVVLKSGPHASPAASWRFSVTEPATVYLGVMDRGTPVIPEGWEKTAMKISWRGDCSDTVYRRAVSPGEVAVPGHDGHIMAAPAGKTEAEKYYGVPNLVIVRFENSRRKHSFEGSSSGPWRRLFLDAMVVEQQSGLKRVFHAVQKHAANPVLRKDKEWEGYGPYLYGTVMWNQGKLRMWYHHYQGGRGFWNSYAESEDGIAWAKPNLGLIEYNGSKENNLVVTHTQDPNEKPPKDGGQCHNASVIYQPWNPDPNRRYALYCYSYEYYVPRVAFSPDGLHWTFAPEPAGKGKGLFTSSDVVNFFYDPYKHRYVATWKSGNRRGRAVGVAESKDGLLWAKPVEGPVFVADDLDSDATQIYGMPVFPYQGLYIGLPWIYNARWFKSGTYSDKKLYAAEMDSPCTMDVQLAWSWDLINWTRPPERACFIPRGNAGEFDSDQIYTARAPVQVGDNLYFYYGGFNVPHNAKGGRYPAAIGLGILRLDGFCSMRAGPEEGDLISRLESFQIPKVTINAKTASDGYVTAELLNGSNQVIPGFSRSECVPFTGDSVRHELAWRTSVLPTAEMETEKKIRFFLKNADMFSYQLPAK